MPATLSSTSQAPVDDWAEPSDDGTIDYGDGDLGDSGNDTSNAALPVDQNLDPSASSEPDHTLGEETVPPGSSDSATTQQPARRDGGQQPQQEAEFPPELLEQSGLTPEQARQYGTAENLRNALTFHTQQLLAAAQRRREQQGQGQQPQQPALPAWQQPQQQQPSQPQQPATSAQQPGSQQANGQQQQLPLNQGADQQGFIQLPEAVNSFDEETQGVLRGIVDQFNTVLRGQNEQIGQFQQLQQVFNQAAQQAQQQELRRFADEFDSSVSQLAGWEKVFGKGAGVDLQPNSPELQARLNLCSTVMALQDERRLQGLPEMSLKSAVELAANAVYPDHFKTLVQGQVSQQLRNRKGQFTARPSARRTQGNPTPEEGAKNFVAEFLRERNADPGDYDTDDNDWL